MKLKEIKQMYEATETTEDTDESIGPMDLVEDCIFGYDEYDHIMDTEETQEVLDDFI